MAVNQLRPGTDSPYRVESPFRIESTDLNSQAACHSSTNIPSFSAPRQDPIAYNLDRPPHLPAATLDPANNHATRDTLMKDAVVTSAPTSRSMDLLPSQKTLSMSSTGRSGFKILPSIKSFLPVNKGGEGHPLHIRKESLGMNSSTMNRRLMPNSSSPSNNWASRTSELAANDSFSPHSLASGLQNDPMETSTSKIARKRRSKGETDEAPVRKKRSSDKMDKLKRMPKNKDPKPEPVSKSDHFCRNSSNQHQARFKLGPDLWMRILEFTPPSFIRKARILNKEFRTLVDKYQSIYLNQRLENYGDGMPGPSRGITERQYNDLLSGKGCMEPGCSDTKASRTHWSWEIRLCQGCWKSKIEREDRLQKMWQNQLTRNGINRLLECIPVGMHDSFMKPHDYIEDTETRARGAPRLYRYHFKTDVDKIVEEYEGLKVPPFKENPEHSAAEKASALAAHQALETESVAKRAEFLEQRKAKNEEHMKRVVLIESAIRNRRERVAKPYDANRNARKKRFTEGAANDLPHIPIEFVQSTKAYKAAVRIFRDPGTERGWQLLKPKIEAEWDKNVEKNDLEDKAGSVVDNNSTTRETSTVYEAESTPDFVLDPMQHNSLHDPNGPPSFSTVHQQLLDMEAAQRNRLIHSLRMGGDLNQFRNSAFHNGISQSMGSGFQGSQRVPVGLVQSTTSFQDQNEMPNRNDFGMTVSGLQPQLPSNFATYATFSNGSSFAHLQNSSSSQQMSNTQIPIDSLLNGPAPRFDHWTGN
jgi:hypothetical protein